MAPLCSFITKQKQQQQKIQQQSNKRPWHHQKLTHEMSCLSYFITIIRIFCIFSHLTAAAVWSQPTSFGKSLMCTLCCPTCPSDCGMLVPCETKCDGLTRARQTENPSNHLSRLFFTTLFGLLTRWMLKINAVNSENLPAGVPGDFIPFIYSFIYLFFRLKHLLCV